MKILMVLSSGKYPPDRRVEREARDLIDDGHAVYLMARRGPDQAKIEEVNGVQVCRVWMPFQNKRLLADLVYYLFQRYVMLWSILRVSRKHQIEALHVHDLPYALVTALAGKLLGLPVVFDMHEHYTAMLEMGFQARSYRLVRPFARCLLFVLRIEERIACRLSRKVIVVADEHIPRVRGLGVNEDDIVVVTNTEDSNYFSGLGVDETLVEKYSSDFVVLYVGMFNPHRGLDTAIRAIPMVREAVSNARLVLVGDGPSRSELEELAQQVGVADSVIFEGYQPFDAIPTYIRLSAVSLISHVSTPHIETTMPNKIFQPMILGKPVIVSNVTPLMRIIDDAKCGLAFNQGDARSLADTILRFTDAKLASELGANGRRAVEDRYNWEQTVQALLDLYR